MKEVLTKSFWQGVKKTFYEALEDAPPPDKASLPEANPKAPVTPALASPPQSTNEQGPPAD